VPARRGREAPAAKGLTVAGATSRAARLSGCGTPRSRRRTWAIARASRRRLSQSRRTRVSWDGVQNPLAESAASDPEDRELVRRAPGGDREALERLITRHQAWIYNIVLRMVYLPQDAEDATQEILVKLVTKLSTFAGKSGFRTWLYRIVVNHVLNMKRGRADAVGDFQPETIVALERGALEGWGKGDPQGFFDIMAPGRDLLRSDDRQAYRWSGRAEEIHRAICRQDQDREGRDDRPEGPAPRGSRGAHVQPRRPRGTDGRGPETTARWNSTEVYQRLDGSWKIVHSHRSYVKPVLKEGAED
jgi:RNA polymerase sigma factor (sigma-70 family)